METQMKVKHANAVEIFIARLTTAYSRQNGLQVLKLMMGKMLFKSLNFTGNTNLLMDVLDERGLFEFLF